LKNRISTEGIANRLRKVDTVSPPIIAAAIDFCEFPKGLKISGKRAKTVVVMVIKIACRRSRAP
jgi:hypothetical protein